MSTFIYSMISNIESHLQNVVQLRKCFETANHKYDELNEICETNKYFPSKEHAFYKFCVEKIKKFKKYEENLSNIRDINKNDFIDIIFVGRCSVGKSKIINAILMENILPCAVAPTTQFFVGISKSSGDKNYFENGESEKKSFDFDNLISEINNVSLISDSGCEFNKNVQIFLSQSKWHTKITNIKQYKMIRLIDTPGFDNYKLSFNSNDNSSIEKLIIDRCKICNIIVLVVTHDLADKEKEILTDLYEISSKLSIWILVNKWDLSDYDSDEITNESKSNIRDSFINNVNKIEHLKNRIYFISGVELMKQNYEDQETKKGSDEHEKNHGSMQDIFESQVKKKDPSGYDDKNNVKCSQPNNSNRGTQDKDQEMKEILNEVNDGYQNMKKSSTENCIHFEERRKAFSKFIQDLNKEINNPSFLKFESQLNKIKTNYDDTYEEYTRSVHYLSNNIEYFINQIIKIKKKLESIKKKTTKNINKFKQKKNINFNSTEKSAFVDKIDKELDAMEEDLENKLQFLYDDFVNSSKYNMNLQQDKSYLTKGWDKTIKFVVNLNPSNVWDWVNYMSGDQATEMSEDISLNDYFFDKLLQCVDKKLSIITDQIDNLAKFFCEYRECLKTL